MSQFAIAGLQLALPQADNVSAIAFEIRKTLKRFPWVNMIVCGELCCFGSSPDNAVEFPPPSDEIFSSLAEELGIWIIPGSQFERRHGEIFNTLSVFNPEGRIVSRYSKIYPFYPYEKGVSCGSEFVLFNVPEVGRFGVSICYDMWFPETIRELTWRGAEVIIHPTMTGTIDRELETCLARANAAMNQVYFIDINCAGELGNGQSIIVDPEGRVLHQAGENQEVIPIEIDLDLVRRTRERGLMGLGQVVKSFRDNPIDFSVYQGAQPAHNISSLSHLDIPKKSTPTPSKIKESV